MTVRSFAVDDADPARAALIACGSFTAEEVGVAVDMIKAGLAGDYHLLTVTTDATFAGYACIGPAPLTRRAWYLYWICLQPASMGTNSGQRLLAGIEAEIRDRGGNRLIVETSGRDAYSRIRRFYEKTGFQACGRIPDFYDEGDDCMLYCKMLGR